VCRFACQEREYFAQNLFRVNIVNDREDGEVFFLLDGPGNHSHDNLSFGEKPGQIAHSAMALNVTKILGRIELQGVRPRWKEDRAVVAAPL